jgi:rare lipoprotein A
MRIAFALALGMVALSGCAHKKTARVVPPPPPPPEAASESSTTPKSATVRPKTTPPPTASPDTPAPAPLLVETGIASWYGHPYHGRVAANGEVYDMEKMTAAHRTLPFDTWVHVVNLNNEKAVDVRITDRGPFIDGRVIDLSHAAARAIDLIGPGTGDVRLEIMSMPDVKPGVYAVQIGAFRSKENAERERVRMASRYGAARLVQDERGPSLWHVLVGSEKTENAADALRAKIRKESGERKSFVVRLDS